jgi:hypothetical protein
MRVLSLTLAAVCNLAFMALAGSTLFAGGVEWTDRVLSLVLALMLVAIVVLLLLASARRVPEWGMQAMRWLTIAVPVLWLVASLDAWKVSGQETAFLLVSVVVAWGTWHAFRRLHPSLR